jgi:hypothetical protein
LAKAEEDEVPEPTLSAVAILDALVREQQVLRAQGADAIALEANRLAIEYWRQRVSDEHPHHTAHPS